MPKISATVITLNEEDYIRGCLESLSWCDEIIVVDSYSDDNTVEIAEEYTDKIFYQERRGDFDSIRKKAISEAEGEWIVQLDADERIPEKLAEKLKDRISKGDNVIKAPRKNLVFGKWTKEKDRWPDYTYCAYQKEYVTISGELHNFLDISDDANIGLVEPKEEYAILHHSVEDISSYISKMNRYTTEEAKDNEFTFEKCFISYPYTFFRKYFYCGLYKEGKRGVILAMLDAISDQILVLKSLDKKGVSK